MFVTLLIMACCCSSLIDLQSLSSQAESFGKIISQLAAEEGVTEDKILLSLSDINILGYDTPSSIDLSVADIIGEFTYINDNQSDISYFVLCWTCVVNWGHKGIQEDYSLSGPSHHCLVP